MAAALAAIKHVRYGRVATFTGACPKTGALRSRAGAVCWPRTGGCEGSLANAWQRCQAGVHLQPRVTDKQRRLTLRKGQFGQRLRQCLVRLAHRSAVARSGALAFGGHGGLVGRCRCFVCPCGPRLRAADPAARERRRAAHGGASRPWDFCARKPSARRPRIPSQSLQRSVVHVL